jgi:DNA-binding transcriptional LysR family regulator
MVPTPAAEAAAGGIRPALRAIASALGNREEFSPMTSARQFVIGLSDYASVVLLPQLLKTLKRKAPGVSLIVKNTGHGRGLRQLEEGDVELIVGNFPAPPPHMEEYPLYKDDFVCAARADHPVFQGPFTMKRFLSLEHVQVSTSGEPHGYVDVVLDASGLKRNVAVTVGHFLIAPLVVQNTELLATEPRRLLMPLAKQFGLKLKRPPFPIPPFDVTQIWHSRHTADAPHAWLRGIVAKCLA